jgi:hypothetical protein
VQRSEERFLPLSPTARTPVFLTDRTRPPSDSPGPQVVLLSY